MGFQTIASIILKYNILALKKHPSLRTSLLFKFIYQIKAVSKIICDRVFRNIKAGGSDVPEANLHNFV